MIHGGGGSGLSSGPGDVHLHAPLNAAPYLALAALRWTAIYYIPVTGGNLSSYCGGGGGRERGSIGMGGEV